MEGNEHVDATKTENSIGKIDLDRVIQNKSPKLYKRLPKFVLRYLKRITHQDLINDFLERKGHLKGMAFAQACLDENKVAYEAVGLENVPKNEQLIFVCNHPLAGFDGLMLIVLLNKEVGETKFVVNDLLMNLPPLQENFIGVNKHGRNTRDAIRELENILKTDQHVFFFPAGLVSRKRKGKIRDLEWKKSFVNKAVQSQRNVVPVFVEGNISNFFYRLSNARRLVGIKANVEMLYLANEAVKFGGRSFKIYFGKPIPYQRFDKTKKADEWARIVQDEVYDLPNQ